MFQPLRPVQNGACVVGVTTLILEHEAILEVYEGWFPSGIRHETLDSAKPIAAFRSIVHLGFPEMESG
jgi:hypothetical protein